MAVPTRLAKTMPRVKKHALVFLPSCGSRYKEFRCLEQRMRETQLSAFPSLPKDFLFQTYQVRKKLTSHWLGGQDGSAHCLWAAEKVENWTNGSKQNLQHLPPDPSCEPQPTYSRSALLSCLISSQFCKSTINYATEEHHILWLSSLAITMEGGSKVVSSPMA